MTIEAGSDYNELGYSAVDSVDGNLTTFVTTSSTLDTNAVGVYTVTYSVNNTAGNTDTATRTITVIESAEVQPEEPFIKINTKIDIQEL